MAASVKRVLLIATGWGMILVGLAGMVLPIMPGIPFAAAGLLILSSEYVWAHQLIRRLRARFPKAFRKMGRYSRFSSALGD